MHTTARTKGVEVCVSFCLFEHYIFNEKYVKPKFVWTCLTYGCGMKKLSICPILVALNAIHKQYGELMRCMAHYPFDVTNIHDVSNRSITI